MHDLISDRVSYRISYREKPDWSHVDEGALRDAPWLAPCGVSAWAQACHDGERLHVRMRAREAAIRAELTGPLCPVCEDSCLEFFFAPDARDARYFNFEWNPLGTLYFGFGGARETRVRQIVPDAQALFNPRPFETEDGWGLTFSVPGQLIRLYFPDFAFEGEAAGNFYKCGDGTKTPHYLAWSPLHSDAPDYHRRQDFGRLTLQKRRD